MRSWWAAQGLGRAGRPRAAADDQLAADDDDARPLPFGQLLGDVPAGGQGAGGGSRGKQEVAQHHDPATEGDVDRRTGSGPGTRPSSCNGRCRWSCHPHGLTKEGSRHVLLEADSGPEGTGARPVGWHFRAWHRIPRRSPRAMSRPDEVTPNWRWHAEAGHGHPGGPAVIFDIDGVLSDAAGRQHFIEQGNRDWSAFFEACGDDPVIEEIARLLELLDASLAVVLLTGRPLRVQPQTLAWLQRYGLRWDLLVMRERGTTPRSPRSSSGSSATCGPTGSTCAWPSRTIRPTTPCTWPTGSPASTSTPATTSRATRATTSSGRRGAGAPTRRPGPPRPAGGRGGHPGGRRA